MKSTEQDRKRKSNRMLVKFALMMMYLTLLSYGLFFAEELGRSRDVYHTVNLVPFNEIKRYFTNIDTLGIDIFLINIVGNIIMFFPFGFLVPAMWPEGDKRHPLGFTLLSCLFSSTVEILQYITKVGSADVDDVILNTLGGFLGFMCYMLWRKLRYGSVNVYDKTQDE